MLVLPSKVFGDPVERCPPAGALPPAPLFICPPPPCVWRGDVFMFLALIESQRSVFLQFVSFLPYPGLPPVSFKIGKPGLPCRLVGTMAVRQRAG